MSLRSLSRTDGAETLLVLLPGAYMTPEHYAEHFFPTVARKGMVLDLLAVDLDYDLDAIGFARNSKNLIGCLHLYSSTKV